MKFGKDAYIGGIGMTDVLFFVSCGWGRIRIVKASSVVDIYLRPMF